MDKRKRVQSSAFFVENGIVTSCQIGNRLYEVLGLMGRGQYTDVYFARWRSSTPELVVLKVGCVEQGFPWMKKEQQTLSGLHVSKCVGADFFTFFLPKPLHAEVISDHEGAERPVIVYKYRNLFDWSLADIRQEYPEGVCERTVVWIWKRLLQLLSFVHANKFAHGAVLPEHIIINAPNHGALLVGWSACAAFGQVIEPIDERQRVFYPPSLTDDTVLVASCELDLYMLARSLVWLVGGDSRTGKLPSKIPVKLADLLRDASGFGNNPNGLTLSAIEMHDTVKRLAREVYGSPAFIPLVLPRYSL
jgi:serine/threonine protein kinase